MVKTEESSKGMVDVVEEQLKALTNVFEGGLASASDALKSSTAKAKNEASKAMGVLEIAYSHFFYALDTADRMVITTLKEGVLYGLEHRVASSAGLAGLVVVMVPGARRAIWRATFGRFTSPEHMVEAFENQIKSMVGSLEVQKGEITKLSERLTMAQEEYARGLSKLQSAASEMRALESRVHRSERNAKNVLYEIRNIRSKHALQLRSDAAVVVESASKQAKQVEKIVGKLDKHGL
ncbi:hypothetical protein M9434_006918 [Picochlorum sp. BPE23]|nr:hypothetical protein M9434_006918 [Picochlorum sp. BPE23]